MAKRMLIDATHPEETRVVVLDGNRLDEFDFETSTKKQVKGNIYLAKVTRVEPSLQAAFVDFGGNRHGFLAFSEIHPDYYRIPIGDRRQFEQEHEGEPERRRPRRERPQETPHEEFAQEETTSAPRPEDAPFAAAPEDNAAPAGYWAPTENWGAGEPETAFRDESVPAPAAEPGEGTAPRPDERTLAEASYGSRLTAPAEAGWEAAQGEQAPPPVEAGLPAEPPAEAGLPAEPPTEARDGAEDDAGAEREASAEATSQAASEAAAAHETMALEASMERAADAHAIETVGGDEFEEAARQRSRSMRHYKIQEVIKRRQIMLVQVTKEERGNKGAALTTYLSLAGRYCVLMPNTGRGGGVSRKITSVADRRRLKDILEELDLPEGMGVIVRTAGSERSKAEIKRDLEYLLRLWDEIRSLTLESTAPALIYEEGNLIKRSIRDLYARDIDEVLVEGEEGYRTAKAFMKMLMPSHAKRVQPYRDPAVPLFHRFQVEGQIDAIHSPVVQLRSGGYIVIDPTEALVAIDVNSGRSTKERNIEETALRTNLEAAEEIARQLRLRDLAGLIVIDFIDMEEHRNQSAVERRLKEAMRFDRARIQLGRISPFGLLELSRQRLRPSLVEASTQPCPHCNGTGHIRSTESTALHVLRAIEDEGIRRRSAEICLYVPTNVALYILNQKREALAQIELRYGFRVTLARDDSLIPPAFRLERLRAMTAIEAAAVPMAIAQLPPPEAEEDEEEEEETAAAESGGERTAEGEEERGRRRRRRRRRRRGDEHEARAAYEPAPSEAVPPEMAATVGEPDEAAAEDMPEAESDALRQHEQEEEGAGGHKRRRRGRRGGRRRARGDQPMPEEGVSEEGVPAADTVEIVPDEDSEPAAAAAVESAFAETSVELAAESVGLASAPVAERVESETRQTPAPWDTPAAAPPEAEPAAPEEEPEQEPKPEPTGSTMPEAKLVTDKPEHPKRGWWQRLLP